MPTQQDQIKNVREGDYIVIEGEACEATKRKTSSAGKHGSTKVRLRAKGIIDGKKRQIVKPSDTKVKVPIIDKKAAQVISVSSDSVQLMDLESYDTFEMGIPDDYEYDIEEGDEVEYWKVMGDKLLKGKK